MAVGVEAEIAAALHVVDAGPIDLVAVDGERLALERALLPDRVEMADQQDAGPVAAPGRTGPDMIAIAVTPRNALDRGAERRQIPGDLGDQHIDGLAIGARRLDLDPAPDAVEDLVGVDFRHVGAACDHACFLRFGEMPCRLNL